MLGMKKALQKLLGQSEEMNQSPESRYIPTGSTPAEKPTWLPEATAMDAQRKLNKSQPVTNPGEMGKNARETGGPFDPRPGEIGSDKGSFTASNPTTRGGSKLRP